MPYSDPKNNTLLAELRGNAPAGDGTYGFMDAGAGVRIYYEYWAPRDSQPGRVAVGFHGMGAHSRYFAMLADELVPHGIALAVMDYRGHGLSGGVPGDLENPELILSDARRFISFISRIFPGVPLYTIGESMGGAVSILVNSDPPEAIRGMVLLAPAVAPAMSAPFPQSFYALFYLLSHLATPGARVIRVSGNEERGMRNPLNIRYNREDPLHLKYVSTRYVLGVKSLVDRARAQGPDSIIIPALVIQGGRDNAVDHRATKRFFDGLKSRDKTFKFYPDAPHCMVSDPEVSDEMLSLIRDWLLAH